MTQAARPAPHHPRRPRRSLRGGSLLRLRVAFIVIAMVLSVFGARLFQLQGLDPQAYAARAQAAGLVNVALPATRGSIVDRNGMALAESVDGLMLVADPTMTEPDAGEIATIMANRLSVDYFEVLERLQKPESRFEYIARRVPSTLATDVVEEVEDAGYRGIFTRRDPVRNYPAKDVAANLVGFMGAEGEAMGGLELAFDPLLSGTDGQATYEVGNGNRLPLGDNSVEEPRNGEDLMLTIDRDVQWYAQRVLRQTVEESAAESGVAIAMDTRTGEVLALADHPTFDANKPLLSAKADLGRRSLSDVYEPGSVQKVLTAAALVDAGKVTPDTRITVPSVLPRQDRVIHDHWDHGKLRLTMTGTVAKSSNIGTVLAADEFSPQELYDYLIRFGLGSRTGAGVGGETPGLVPFWEKWSQITQDTISFGQGISVNALQMAAAVNTIANGGVYVPPSVVKGAESNQQGTVVGSDSARGTRVVSEEAAAQTRMMMEMVTDPEKGTAATARIDGYRVAGKTGTAQRVGEECGCYDGTFTVSFAGFAPADDPRFLVYVVVQAPQRNVSGSGTAAPAFRKILTYLLRRYAVPPTGAKSPDAAVEW